MGRYARTLHQSLGIASSTPFRLLDAEGREYLDPASFRENDTVVVKDLTDQKFSSAPNMSASTSEDPPKRTRTQATRRPVSRGRTNRSVKNRGAAQTNTSKLSPIRIDLDEDDEPPQSAPTTLQPQAASAGQLSKLRASTKAQKPRQITENNTPSTEPVSTIAAKEVSAPSSSTIAAVVEPSRAKDIRRRRSEVPPISKDDDTSAADIVKTVERKRRHSQGPMIARESVLPADGDEATESAAKKARRNNEDDPNWKLTDIPPRVDPEDVELQRSQAVLQLVEVRHIRGGAKVLARKPLPAGIVLAEPQLAELNYWDSERRWQAFYELMFETKEYRNPIYFLFDTTNAKGKRKAQSARIAALELCYTDDTRNFLQYTRHSNNPNMLEEVSWDYESKRYRVQLRTTREVKAGEELCVQFRADAQLVQLFPWLQPTRSDSPSLPTPKAA
eukprot:GILK01006412.1.p1 GENE.GILK01006412.1~~GILK01006412.1.p1  ORF type:complete len:446 (+),score=66.08 GILK01006412.1:228-1565(+)